MWETFKKGVAAIAGIVKFGNWFTKKKDQADEQESGAAKQRSKDADETIGAVADAASANLRPGSERAKRLRAKYTRP